MEIDGSDTAGQGDSAQEEQQIEVTGEAGSDVVPWVVGLGSAALIIAAIVGVLVSGLGRAGRGDH